MNSSVQNISIQISNDLKELEKDTDSIGSFEDLKDLDEKKLGFNLPTNDLSKAGNLDAISVDSYFVGDDELEDINVEKQLDPMNPNYKIVYEKMKNKYITPVETNEIKPSDQN